MLMRFNLYKLCNLFAHNFAPNSEWHFEADLVSFRFILLFSLEIHQGIKAMNSNSPCSR
jgi:hypothetical protein